jgi:ribosome maturation protein Sdo1
MKTEDQKKLIETIISNLPWGGYAMVKNELKKKEITFGIDYIKKVLSTKTKWWNVDIINAAMEVCNQHLDKIKASKQKANDLIEKLNNAKK